MVAGAIKAIRQGDLGIRGVRPTVSTTGSTTAAVMASPAPVQTHHLWYQRRGPADARKVARPSSARPRSRCRRCRARSPPARAPSFPAARGSRAAARGACARACPPRRGPRGWRAPVAPPQAQRSRCSGSTVVQPAIAKRAWSTSPRATAAGTLLSIVCRSTWSWPWPDPPSRPAARPRGATPGSGSAAPGEGDHHQHQEPDGVHGRVTLENGSRRHPSSARRLLATGHGQVMCTRCPARGDGGVAVDRTQADPTVALPRASTGGIGDSTARRADAKNLRIRGPGRAHVPGGV